MLPALLRGGYGIKKTLRVANAPIFSFDDGFFGDEIVGGPMLSIVEDSRKAAAVAIRILDGERPEDIKTPPQAMGRRNSTGGYCSAGASAKAGCRPAARSVSQLSAMGSVSLADGPCQRCGDGQAIDYGPLV